MLARGFISNGEESKTAERQRERNFVRGRALQREVDGVRNKINH
jgi:hypothetical protein